MKCGGPKGAFSRFYGKMAFVKTTVELPDSLFRKAKALPPRRAKASKISLRRLFRIIFAAGPPRREREQALGGWLY